VDVLKRRHLAVALPKLYVVTINKPLSVLFGDLIVWANKFDCPEKLAVRRDDKGPVSGHSGLLQSSQVASQELCDIGRPQWIVALAIEALKLPASDVLAEQESHWLAALCADGGRGVFRHDAHAGSGASVTGLTVTDYCLDWGGDT
jgi:hypothetical protein